MKLFRRTYVIPVITSLIITILLAVFVSRKVEKQVTLDSLKSNELANAQAVSTINGVLRPLAPDYRYFTNNSGKAVYLTGSHVWTGLVGFYANDGKENQAIDFDQYLLVLEQNNQNFARLWAQDLFRFDYYSGATGFPASGFFIETRPFPYLRTGPGIALDGKPKFDLSKYDQTYFDKLRSNVQKARNKNIYVSVMFFDGHAPCRSKAPLNWNGNPYNDANNINQTGATANTVHTVNNTKVNTLQKAYIKKVIDSVNEFDNVLYEIVNEDLCGQATWQYAMIDYVKQYQATLPKQHPVGMTSRSVSGSDAELFDARNKSDWISPARDVVNGFEYKGNPPQDNRGKVIISDTDHLWGVGGDYVWVWKSFTRGLNPIYMDPITVNRYDALPADISRTRRSMGDTNRYAKTMDLAQAKPRQDICSTVYCLVQEGKQYLVFQPADGASFTVQVVAGTYAYEWFNASTSSVVQTGTATYSSGRATFTPPFNGKAVLYLRSTATTATPTIAPTPARTTTPTVAATPTRTITPTVTTSPVRTPTPTPSPTPSPIVTQGPVTSGNTLIVTAAGSVSSGVAMPIFEVRVKDVSMGSRTVTGQLANYSFTVPAGTQPSDVKVVYTNDFSTVLNGVWTNRDLRVDSISLNGVIYRSDAIDTYSTGTWANADGCAAGFKKSVWLHCGGYFQYKSNQATVHIEAENFNATGGYYTVQGVETAPGVLKTPTYVYRFDPRDWIKYSSVNLSGKTKLDIRIAPRTNSGTIEARIGSQTGAIIGTLTTSNADQTLTSYTTQTMSLTQSSGIADLYLISTNTYEVGRIDWIELK